MSTITHEAQYARFSRLTEEAGPEIDRAIQVLKENVHWLREYAEWKKQDSFDTLGVREALAAGVTRDDLDRMSAVSAETSEILGNTADGLAAAVDAWERIVATGFLWQTEGLDD